ncbi:hypothetical protein ACFL6R_04280 [Gemmatimonadota bacterium]
MMCIRTVPLLMVTTCIILLSSCGRSGDSWVRESVDPDGVRIVENGSVPEEWTGRLPIMRYEDTAVIGEGGRGDDYLLSSGTSGGLVGVGPDGQVGYTERQPPELRVFGTDGNLRWKAGREGEGPGEFRVPMRPQFVPEVGWIVNAPILHRLIVFDEEGGFVRNRLLDPVPRARHFTHLRFLPNGDFWILAHRSIQGEMGQDMFYYPVWIEWSDLRYVQTDSFRHVSVVKDDSYTYMYEENPANMAVDGQGRAWVNCIFPYQIEVYAPGGSDQWRIRREYELTGFPDAYRESIESEPFMEMEEEIWYLRLPERQAAIAGMNWTENNEMWVFQTAWVDSPLVQVDVFNEDGVFKRAFLADRRLRGMPIGAEHLWRSDEAEDGSPLLIRSRYWFEDRE